MPLKINQSITINYKNLFIEKYVYVQIPIDFTGGQKNVKIYLSSTSILNYT